MPPDTVHLIQIGAVSILAGAFGAIMGIGGGLILVPVLVAIFHIQTDVARLSSLVAVCVTSAAGSLVYLREGVVDLGKASYLQLPTAVGALAGASIGRLLSENVVRILFAVFLILTAVRMLQAREVNSPKPSTAANWGVAILLCVAAGVVSSVLGVGGGIVFVPVLALLLGKSQREAAATSTFLIGLTGAASALIYLQDHLAPARQTALLAVAIPSAIGILIGAQLGARFSKHIANEKLRHLFALVMVTNAGLLVWKVLHG